MDVYRLDKAANLAEYYGADSGQTLSYGQLASNLDESQGVIYPNRRLSSTREQTKGYLAQTFELRLSHPSLAGATSHLRGEPALSSYFDQFPVNDPNIGVRRAQMLDS